MDENSSSNQAWRNLSRRHFVKIAALGVASAALTTGLAVQTTRPTSAAPVNISKATYRDKTLAGILGQVAGVLSGYEFIQNTPLADSYWTGFTYGPYSGDNPYYPPSDYPGFDRLNGPHFLANQVGGDDDYHMEFFIQHMFNDLQSAKMTYQYIRDRWLYYYVGDWGGPAEAMRLMRDEGMIPPLTGQAEFNYFYWLTEAYIETEMVGMLTPGMPNAGRDLTGKFASVVAEGDPVIWAKFLGTMYALAYFNNDAPTIMAEASKVLPRNSWPYQMYQAAVNAHATYPTNWRSAQAALMNIRRNVYQTDNPMAIPDINNGSLVLAILYGNNDYTETGRIASLIGNDADCTASAALGLMGIIKGTAGTPQVIRDRLNLNNAGVYVNDTTTCYPPRIRQNYPASETWTAIVDLYQQNAERFITANGGTINATSYDIQTQTLATEDVVVINNYDFETGNLNGWSTTNQNRAYAEKNGTAQSGNWKGTIYTASTSEDVKLYVTLTGLTTGATYRANAYVQANQQVRLYAENYGGSYIYAEAVSTFGIAHREWVTRSLEFTVTGTTAQVGIHIPAGVQGWANIDNLYVQKISVPAKTRYEAENVTVSGGVVRTGGGASNGAYIGGLNNVGSYLQFTASPGAGEYRLSINYANAWTDTSKLSLYINGVYQGVVPFPRTAAWGTFQRNLIHVPVSLAAGSNTIKLTKENASQGFVEVDYFELGDYPAPVYNTPAGGSTSTSGTGYVVNSPDASMQSGSKVHNPSYEDCPAPQANSIPLYSRGWQVWPGPSGQDGNASYTELGGHSGLYRNTHSKATAYEVYTYQNITGLTNGLHTLKAWVVTTGGQIAKFMSAKNYGGAELTATIPANGGPNWQQITISDIPVTNGTCTIGFYSKANAGNWLSFDDVEFYRQVQ